MKTFQINSITSAGVNVTFTHDDNTTHTETLSGPVVPLTNANGELAEYLTRYGQAWDAGKAIESGEFDLSANELVGVPVNVPPPVEVAPPINLDPVNSMIDFEGQP